RALADDAADDLLAAAGGVPGELRTEGARIDRRRQVADPAGLRQDLAALALGIGETVVWAGLLGGCALRPNGEHEHESGGAALHPNPPDVYFCASLRLRCSQRKVLARIGRL